MQFTHKMAAAALLFSLAAPATAKLADPLVLRMPEGAFTLSWASDGPVDVYVSDRPDTKLAAARLLSARDADGHHDYVEVTLVRPYFLLRDVRSETILHVAERLVPLQQGSNFRDIGGYAGAGGKHIRWGLLYRSGGSPQLSDGDTAIVASLGLKQLVDLRSSEERVLAPTRIFGVPYTAVGYSLATMMKSGGRRNGVDTYRNFPLFLAPQLRIIFAQMLSGQTPMAYNCSAGQDRTGFATAMILSALGVSRATIIEDYHLSTKYRRPEFEMPMIDAAAHPGDAAAQMFASYQKYPAWRTPTPLKEADGRPFLSGAFVEIETKWGSVDAYLEKEIGVSAKDRKRLRQLYLE
jgi:protein-tyrosine phosphatase